MAIWVSRWTKSSMRPIQSLRFSIKSWQVTKKYSLGWDRKLTLILAMQIDQDKLRSENNNLIVAFREKSRKHQQTQELFNRLKRKEMTSATQSAAVDSVDEVLGSFQNRQGQSIPNQPHHYQIISGPESHPGFTHLSTDHNAMGQTRIHERTGSSGSHGNSKLMPSPSHRIGTGSRAFDSGVL